MSQIRLESGTAGGLLERDGELPVLADRLEEVERSGRGHVARVRGEAEIGKTTLICAFCDDRAGSAQILLGACDPLFTPRPLGRLLEVAQAIEGELGALVERGARPYEVVAPLAEELNARAPCVFVLEDIHWADEATLDVFRLPVRRIERIPALAVASYRDDGLELAYPLRIVLGELATSRSISRLRLTGLFPSAVAELAQPYGADPDELYGKSAETRSSSSRLSPPESTRFPRRCGTPCSPVPPVSHRRVGRCSRRCRSSRRRRSSGSSAR